MKKIQRITATIHPGSSRRKVEIKNGGIHIYTTAKPVEGQANRDAVKILSGYLHLPKRDVRIVKGLKSRQKIFEIHGNVTINAGLNAEKL